MNTFLYFPIKSGKWFKVISNVDINVPQINFSLSNGRRSLNYSRNLI